MTGEKEISNTGFEVAIIGMTGRFPGAQNIDEYWENLKSGIETISFFTREELENSGMDREMLEEPGYVNAKGILEDSEYFDPAFFGYTHMEAERMAPQIRVLHECTWQALEDAGYDPGVYKGLIGLYVGATNNLKWQSLIIHSGISSSSEGFASMQLCDKDHISTRISYKLNLSGPSFTLETQCSTSLVAVHLAYQGLLSGECDMALAGGISVSLPLKSGYIYQEGMVDSEDGHCRPFDATATGTVFGNGVGMVVLKRLGEAMADRDHIYAVIRGSAINNDGNRKVGYTAPSVEGQADVIRSALQMAEVEPESISYVEAHGTGTALGDPIEVEALTQAFNTDKKKFCKIGSVKSNLGHLADAAGVAGLIKTALALKNRLIPPSIHFNSPNIKIGFDNTPFYVNTKLTEWERGTHPLRAGVSSFGIGGTNAHIILEEAPEPSGHVTAESIPPHHLLLFSAETETTLLQAAQNLGSCFKKNPGLNLADAAYTLMQGRKAFKKRQTLVCASIQEAIDALENQDQGKIQNGSPAGEKTHVVFMFSGQGPQYVNMGRDLYREESSFREDVDQCLDILKSIFGHDVTSILYPGKSSTNEKAEDTEIRERGKNKIDEVIYSGPIKFILDYSLSRLFMRWGVQPTAMIGHSFGEYVAACLSGVFSLEDALRVVVLRGQLMGKTPPGIMMSVPLPEEELKPLLNEDISLAAVNTSSLCIVSGSCAAVEALENQLKEKGHECVRLNFPHASHSKMMEPILEEFKDFIASLPRNKPRLPYISNVTGTWITAGQAVDPAYYATHMRQTVRFADGITELLKNPHTVFVQVGPGRGLALFVDQHPDKQPAQLTVHLLRHPREKIPDTRYLLNRIGQLWLSGVNIDWSAFYAGEKRHRLPLPVYPFSRKRYWKYIDEYLKYGRTSDLGKKKYIKEWFYLPTWKPTAWPVHQEPAVETPQQSCWLVFLDECGLGEKLAKQLEQENHQVITVRQGAEFAGSKDNESEFIINPRQDDDYDILFDELQAMKKIPANILHLWGVTNNRDNHDYLELSPVEKTLDLGFYSLINLAKAYGKHEIKNELTIGVISTNMQEFFEYGKEVTSPGKATVLGPIRVIPTEYPNIRCFSVDIVLPEPGSRHESRLTVRLLSEFFAEPSNPVIVYRGNHRLEETFAPIKLMQVNGEKSRLKEEGVYLIIGGLGGVGLVLAEYLARTVQARLILVRRSAFPPRQDWEKWLSDHDENDGTSGKIRKVRELEQMGARVLVLTADVANLEQMQQLVTRSEEKFGRINGVIHSAMVVDGSVIPRRTRQMSERVLIPKIQGTIVLERIFRDKQLDFFLICSSVASFLGSVGEVSYCAANDFQDSFVLHKNHGDDSTFYLSINWDAWQEVGQAAKTAEKFSEAFKIDFVGHGILPEEGIEVFERIMAGDLHQVVVSTRNLNALSESQYVKKDDISPSSGEDQDRGVSRKVEILHNRPELNSEYAVPVTDKEKMLVNIWQNFFGVQPVGIEDNFFELGGDSLKAMIVSAIINREMKVKVSVTGIFSNPTVKELAVSIGGEEREVKSKYSLIEPAEKRDYLPLSSAQKRLYVLQQMEKNTTGYNEILTVVLEGKLEREQLEGAVHNLIKRHEILRTSFEMVGGEPVQRIHDYEAIGFAVEFHDFSVSTADGDQDNPSDGAENGVGHNESINRAKFIRPFDLSRAPLLRMGVIKIAPDQHILIADMHHITADGTSQGIFAEEFMALYTGGKLPDLLVQYKDFSQWQNRQKQEENLLLKKQETYWLKEFHGELPVLALPLDYERPGVQSYEGKRLTFEMDREQTKALKKCVENHGVTLFIMMLSIYNILLSRLCGQEDIVIGTPSAGRGHPDTANMMGMFINTLALRNFPHPDQTFNQFLAHVKVRTLAAFENQDYPFEDLVEKVEVNRDASRNPIFDAVLVLHNYIVESADVPEIQAASLNLRPCQYENPTSKFDFILHVKEAPNQGLYLIVEYCTRLFRQESIRRFIGFFKNIVDDVLENPEKKISTLDILSETEKKELLNLFHDTGAGYPSGKILHRLFEEQVEYAPDHIALVEGNWKPEFQDLKKRMFHLSYRELSRKSDQLSQRLREKGAKADTIAAIMVEEAPDMITGILGILKAGSAYLPIDPDYPEERQQYMLKDSTASILVTSASLEEKTKKFKENPETIFIDSLQEFNSPSSQLLNFPTSHFTNLAYVIYTSGTTGKPKGTLIQHENVVRLLFNDRFQFDFNSSDVWTQFHSFCFDFSVWEMYGALLYGGKLVLIPRKIARNPLEFLEILKQEAVTVLNQTPAAFYNLANVEARIPRKDLKLRYVIFGGEALAPIKLKKWQKKYPRTKLVNMYGITETTVHVTYKEINEEDILLNISNIGKPIPTLSIYVMDRNRNLVPIGVTGELCVGGKGVGRGYLNRPALTAEKFKRAFNDTIYCSGDLVRILGDSELEYLGRIDHQVKIRGFRIELEEIEYRLLTHDKIKEAIVLPIEEKGREKYLSAYIVSNNGLGAAELRKYLSLHLPDYMIPSYFIPIDEVPLTSSGKLDRKVLTSVSAVLSSCEKFTPPKSDLEKKIADTWKKILGIEAIGTTDNYFDVGGNSINILNLSLELEKVLEREIHVAKLFQYPTIAAFSRHLQVEKENPFKEMSKKEPSKAREVQFEDVKNRFKKKRKRDATRRQN